LDVEYRLRRELGTPRAALTGLWGFDIAADVATGANHGRARPPAAVCGWLDPASIGGSQQQLWRPDHPVPAELAHRVSRELETGLLVHVGSLPASESVATQEKAPSMGSVVLLVRAEVGRAFTLEPHELDPRVLARGPPVGYDSMYVKETPPEIPLQPKAGSKGNQSQIQSQRHRYLVKKPNRVWLEALVHYQNPLLDGGECGPHSPSSLDTLPHVTAEEEAERAEIEAAIEITPRGGSSRPRLEEGCEARMRGSSGTSALAAGRVGGAHGAAGRRCGAHTGESLAFWDEAEGRAFCVRCRLEGDYSGGERCHE